MANVRPVPESYYYSGQGRLLIGERDPNTGRPLRMYAVGNVSALEIQVAVTTVQHKESMSGDRATDLTLVTEKTPTCNITFESLSLKNLVTAFWGTETAEAAGTVTGETLVLTRGAVVPLANPGVSDLELSLSGGGTLAEEGNYDIDPAFGTIYVKADAADIPAGEEGVTVTAAYSFADHSRLDALTQVAPPERFLRFEGLNTINGDAVLVEIPRASFQPLQSLPLINEEVAQAEVTVDILLDPFITSGSKYYRQRIVPANFAAAPTVTSIQITPASISADVSDGTPVDVTAVAHMSNGSTVPITSASAFQSSATGVFTVGATGTAGAIQVTPVSAGNGTLTVTYGGQTATAPVTVTA